MYIPNLVPHAVYNVDETVSVAWNPYYATAIDESAYDTLVNNHTCFARVNGSNINILECKYLSTYTIHRHKYFFSYTF